MILLIGQLFSSTSLPVLVFKLSQQFFQVPQLSLVSYISLTLKRSHMMIQVVQRFISDRQENPRSGFFSLPI
jgi:hypothetical protein